MIPMLRYNTDIIFTFYVNILLHKPYVKKKVHKKLLKVKKLKKTSLPNLT